MIVSWFVIAVDSVGNWERYLLELEDVVLLSRLREEVGFET